MHREDTLQRTLRHLCLSAPFFLPLMAVVGALLGGQCWGITVTAFFIAHTLKLWRQFICAFLCTGIAIVQADLQQRNREQLLSNLQKNGYVYLVGTVERTLASGCILDTGWQGARVALRGNIPGRTGDRIAVYADARDIRPAPVKGMFDTERWLKSQGLAADLRVQTAQYMGMSTSIHAVKGMAEAVREKLMRNIMPPGTEYDERRQILCALALGDKSGAAPEVMNVFKRGGCLHAFAVSGLHVGIVAAFLYMLGYYLRLRPRTQMFLVVIVAGLYVLVTGLAVPALRAYTMIVLVLLGKVLLRQVSMLNIWSLSALALLLIEPWQLGNAGFVLSYAVYAGIGVGVKFCMSNSPWFHPDSYLPRRLYTAWHDRLCKLDYTIRGTVAVSLSAWLISVPITAAFFHTATPYSFLTNITIAPLLPIVMGTGLAAAIAGGVPWLGGALHWAALKSCSVLLAVVSFFGELPMAYVPFTSPAEADTTIVCATGAGESFVMLGSPGLLINQGSGATARFNTEPVLFFSGCRPAALWQIGTERERVAAVNVLKSSWPDLIIFEHNMYRAQVMHLNTAAGRFDIYPPSMGTSHDSNPVIIWRRNDGSKVLCVGNATLQTYNSVPLEERKADVFILGHNEMLPPEFSTVLKDSGASQCILLPGVTIDDGSYADGSNSVRIVRVDDSAPLFRMPESRKTDYRPNFTLPP